MPSHLAEAPKLMRQIPARTGPMRNAGKRCCNVNQSKQQLKRVNPYLRRNAQVIIPHSIIIFSPALPSTHSLIAHYRRRHRRPLLDKPPWEPFTPSWRAGAPASDNFSPRRTDRSNLVCTGTRQPLDCPRKLSREKKNGSSSHSFDTVRKTTRV